VASTCAWTLSTAPTVRGSATATLALNMLTAKSTDNRQIADNK
jgi:hypothetical protein